MYYTRKLNINITAICLHNFYNKSYFGESNKKHNDIMKFYIRKTDRVAFKLILKNHYVTYIKNFRENGTIKQAKTHHNVRKIILLATFY